MDQLGLKFAEVPILCYYTVLVVRNGLDWIGLKPVETRGEGGGGEVLVMISITLYFGFPFQSGLPQIYLFH